MKHTLDKEEVQFLFGKDAKIENVSDGYHTFSELYNFRMLYNALLFNEWANQDKYEVHKSKKHSDGKECFDGDYFIVQAQTDEGQISNHYELKWWYLFRVPEYEKALPFDGHTSEDVMQRLQELC